MNARSLALLLVLLVPACDAEEASGFGARHVAAQVEDIGALIPTDATVYVQVESLEALQLALDTIIEAVGGAEELDARAILASALPGADLGPVAADRPLGFAISWSGSVLPALTLMLPTDDPQALIAANEATLRSAPVSEGGWVAFSTAAALDLTSPRVELTRDLPAGVVSIRSDLETLLENWRPLIEGSLDAMEERIAAAPVEDLPPGFSPEAFMGWYFDLFRALLDSARTLEVGWDVVDGVLINEGALHVKPESPMDGLFPEDPYQLEGRRFLIDEQSCVQGAYAMNLRRALELCEPFFEALLEMNDDEFESRLARLWQSFLPIAERAGRVVTFSADIGPEAVCFLYGLENDDPPAFLDEIRRALEEQGLAVEDTELVVAGESLLGLDVTLTPATVHGWLTSMTLYGGGSDPPPLEEIDQSLSRFAKEYDYFLRVLAREKHVLLAFGIDEDGLVPRLERVFAQADTPPPALAPMLRRIEGADAGAVFWFDFGQLLRDYSGLLRSFGRDVELPREIPSMPWSVCAAVDGPVYRWGASIDLGGLHELGQSLDEGVGD